MHFGSTIAYGLAALSSVTVAHPGHDIKQEIAEREAHLSNFARSDLSHCQEKFKARGLDKRNSQRRANAIQDARNKRGLTKRDEASILATNHNMTDSGYSAATDPSLLFAGNNTCIFTPDQTSGPFYVSGERIRSNITETQQGITTFLDYQLVDIDTCDPILDVYLEIWHCNSTGVYSGVISAINGNPNDTSNVDKTFYRGIQKTDEDGVATFVSHFPGHYTQRATHIHFFVHTNVTVYPNGTLGNGDQYAAHVSQGFYDQALINATDNYYPYSDNTNVLWLNEQDDILASQTETGYDPMHEYVYLGDDLSDGLFMWLGFGVNTSESSNIEQASWYYADGGEVNSEYCYTCIYGNGDTTSSSASTAAAAATTSA